VGAAYALAAWLFIQVAETIFPLFGFGDTPARIVVIVLAIGFLPVLIFAWAFEMTPDGVKKERDVDRSHSISPHTGKKLDRVIMAALALALGYFAFDKFVMSESREASIAESARQEGRAEARVDTTEPSIAVLPFMNMSNETNQEYFSDGISEEVLNLLVQVEGLEVASRTSSFTYKGENLNLPEIAAELKVNYILEGSVRKDGDRLRITAQLIDAGSDRHLWSDSFDRNMNDIFQTQEDIANAIVTALTTKLGIGLQVIDIGPVTSNISAYDLYLEARELFIARENLPKSWQLLEQATEMDPQFARAWETLAAVHGVANSWDRGDGIDHNSLALAAARRALEIDPDLSTPYAVIGMKFQVTGEGYFGAIRNLDTAIEKDPKNATAWLWRGITFENMGYFEKATADFERCLDIDPKYLLCSQHLASGLLSSGQMEEAITQFEKTLKFNFHALDDPFVSYYVHTGQRNMAFMVGTVDDLELSQDIQYSLIEDWIEAIENPLEDHAAQVARFNEWGAAYNIDVCDMDSVAVALRQDACFASVENAGLMWHPDASYYRKTPAFKSYVNTHLRDYWQQNGPPPQCRQLDDGDFECN
jgi:TolB-like protein/tetratricopeptide (TPR) repeat protein